MATVQTQKVSLDKLGYREAQSFPLCSTALHARNFRETQTGRWRERGRKLMLNLRFRYRPKSMKGTEGTGKVEEGRKIKGDKRTIKYPLVPG